MLIADYYKEPIHIIGKCTSYVPSCNVGIITGTLLDNEDTLVFVRVFRSVYCTVETGKQLDYLLTNKWLNTQSFILYRNSSLYPLFRNYLIEDKDFTNLAVNEYHTYIQTYEEAFEEAL